MRLVNALMVCLFLAVAAGCTSSSAPNFADANRTNIQKLKNAYMMYMNDHGFTGPEDEAALKSYLRENPAAKIRLGRMGVNPEDIDSIFTSERDGEPFVIRWGVKGLADHAIVFEKTGVDGKRFVALGTPKEVDAAEYEGWLSGEIKPAAPGALVDESANAAEAGG